MSGDSIDFEADSAAAIGDSLGAECDAWRKRQCVDREWFKRISSKNLRGNASRVRLRFVRKGASYFGRASFSILVSPLSNADSILSAYGCPKLQHCRGGYNDGKGQTQVGKSHQRTGSHNIE